MAGDQPPTPANDNARAAQKPANDNVGKSGPPPGGAGGGDKPPPSPPPGAAGEKAATNQPPADKPSQPPQGQQQSQGERGQQDKGQQGEQGDKGQQQAQGDKGQQQGQGDKGRQVPGEAGPPPNDNTPRAGQAANDNTQRAAAPQSHQTGRGGSEVPAGVTAGAGGTKRADAAEAADQVKPTDSAAARTGDAKPANDHTRSTDAAKSTDANRATAQNGRNDGSVQTRGDQSATNKNDSSTDRKGAESTDRKGADKEAKQDKVGGAGGNSAALAARGASSRDANAVQQGRPGRPPTTIERNAARQAKADKRANELRKRQEDRKENRKLRKEATRDAAEKKDLFHGMTDKQKADCINQYRMQTEAAVHARQDNPRTAHLYPKDFDAKRGAATWEESMRKNFSNVEMKVGSDGKTRYLKTPAHPKDHIKDGSLHGQHQFQPGDKLDRCGSNRGKFGSVEQTTGVKDHGDIKGKSTFDDRALPGSSISADYSRFTVNKPFACDISQAAPSATRPGGGWQIDLSTAQLPVDGCEKGKTPGGKDLTFKWMVDNGYLRETYTTRKAK